MSPLVLVTGATGFIASHLIRELLDRGYRVRGTVRDLSKPEKVAHLRALEGSERLELVEADLTRPGSFHEPARGCEGVFHTASPYALSVKDPQRDLVDPAVAGTRTVLEAAKAAGTVTRVVLTSSMAAITDEPDGGRLLSEDDWNTKSTLTRNPYYLSKALAEREAWRFVEEKPGFDLVVINPFMTIGPSLSPGLNTSNRLFVDLCTGQYPAIMSLAWGFVDVRDVALAHVLAMETPYASGRHICAQDALSMRDLVLMLREQGFGRFKLPTVALDHVVGTWLVWLMSWAQPAGTGSYLRTHLGRVPRYDHRRVSRELGLRLRPLERTVRDTMEDLIAGGYLR